MNYKPGNSWFLLTGEAVPVWFSSVPLGFWRNFMK